MNTRSGQIKLKEEFEDLRKKATRKFNHNLKSENCTGDYIIESKNCHDCFNVCKSEDCVRVGNIDAEGKDCRDQNYIAECELCYEGTSIAGYHNVLCVFMGYGQDNLYCNFCDNCKNCFGCAGLTRKEYCIFNKEYTKEEYEKIVPKIIEKMQADGEWGELFPASISTFAYNESVAQDYFPKSKEEAEKFGSFWQDKNYESEFNGSTYEPLDGIGEYNDNEEQVDKLLGGVIKCEKTGKPFKVLPQELSFYLKNNIPIPTVHYSERFKELFALRNPRVLYERRCDCVESGHDHSGPSSAEATGGRRCENKFQTTYVPDRPEKVYCEKCYQQSVV